jgi:hypothetical protein
MPGIVEQPVRRECQQKLQVQPAVAPAAQVRRAGAPVRAERRRDLGHLQTHDRGLDHHLGGELHPRRVQLEPEDGLTRETAQAAMEITDRRAEEHAPDRRKNGIAEVPVQGRHGAGRDPALEAVAHDQVGPAAEFFDEGVQPREIVAVVAVAHDDVAPAGGGDAGTERGTVALDRDIDHARA